MCTVRTLVSVPLFPHVIRQLFAQFIHIHIQFIYANCEWYGWIRMYELGCRLLYSRNEIIRPRILHNSYIVSRSQVACHQKTWSLLSSAYLRAKLCAGIDLMNKWLPPAPSPLESKKKKISNVANDSRWRTSQGEDDEKFSNRCQCRLKFVFINY